MPNALGKPLGTINGQRLNFVDLAGLRMQGLLQECRTLLTPVLNRVGQYLSHLVEEHNLYCLVRFPNERCGLL